MDSKCGLLAFVVRAPWTRVVSCRVRGDPFPDPVLEDTLEQILNPAVVTTIDLGYPGLVLFFTTWLWSLLALEHVGLVRRVVPVQDVAEGTPRPYDAVEVKLPRRVEERSKVIRAEQESWVQRKKSVHRLASLHILREALDKLCRTAPPCH